MKAEIITLTPELAKTLLEKNVGNRKLKKSAKSSYVSQMKRGLWKENGEPIIVDSNGFIKDGQHRLNAVIATGFSYKVPLITDVDPNVMDTIDTGTNRSLGDVLELNGFKYYAEVASLIKTILKHDLGMIGGYRNGGDKYTVSNSVGLDFAYKNENSLYLLCRSLGQIRASSKATIISNTDLSWLLYAIAGFDVRADHISFMKGIYSGHLGKESCTYYAFSKYLNAHINKVKLDKTYIFNLMARCWSIYKSGDMPIRSLRITTDKLESINN